MCLPKVSNPSENTWCKTTIFNITGYIPRNDSKPAILGQDWCTIWGSRGYSGEWSHIRDLKFFNFVRETPREEKKYSITYDMFKSPCSYSQIYENNFPWKNTCLKPRQALAKWLLAFVLPWRFLWKQPERQKRQHYHLYP